MATEAETEQFLGEEERRYKDRILYENIILQRINAVIFALDNHYSATDPLQLLCSILIPDIRVKIKDKLVDLEQDYDKQISKKELSKIIKRDRNKRHESEIKRTFERIYVMRSLQVIIDELDKHGLLISKDRSVEVGGTY